MIYTLSNFYKSKEWERFRLILINERTNEEGFVMCAHCGKPIVKRYDMIAHHKQELTEDNVNNVEVAFNHNNVDIIHFKCHNELHARFGYEGKKKVYIVYGAPCSGKSTYVKGIAQPNDIIVDMDSIYQCISNSDRYTNTNRLSSVAFEIRDKLYEVIKYRSGKWHNAYIIGGFPLVMDRVRLEQRLHAECIFIDETKEECLLRLCKSARPAREWEQYINEWFDKYQAN